MTIRKISLTHIRVPLVEPFRISSGAVAEKDAIIVRVEADEGVGYGESSPMAGSFYSTDTPETCWRELCENLVPPLIGQSVDTRQWLETTKGSNFAKVGIETALWDIAARAQKKPLHELLGGTRPQVESGLAVGLYDNVDDLLRTIERYLPDGYKRVKIKIERGRDVELVRAVRKTFGEIPLFVDANGAYDLTDLKTFQELDQFGLMMFEQPFPGPMLTELAELQRNVQTPVCLDESIESEDDLKEAIRLGSMRIVNIKIQRVGGFGPSLRICDICRENGIPVWVGTMPELGIGQAQAMALATRSECCYPTDVEASLRWFRDDVIDPMLEVRDGHLNLQPGAGIGFEVDERKLQRYLITTAAFG